MPGGEGRQRQAPRSRAAAGKERDAVSHHGPYRSAGQRSRARRDELREDRTHHPGRGRLQRWDPATDDEETLSALTDLRRAGKIRYFGSSTFPPYRIVQAQWAARENHPGRYVTEQPAYSVLRRGVEAHVLPVTEQYGLGVLAWSPPASGRLSGAVREGRAVTTNRSTFMPERFDVTVAADRAKPDAVERLAEVAGQAGLT